MIEGITKVAHRGVTAPTIAHVLGIMKAIDGSADYETPLAAGILCKLVRQCGFPGTVNSVDGDSNRVWLLHACDT